MNSWNGRVKSLVRAWARSTCSSPSTSRRVRSPGSSEPEEDGFTVPLKVDVEAVAAVLDGGDQRLTPLRPERGQQRVGGVGLRLVAEVDARRDAVEQAAREHRDGDVRRLAALGGGLAGDDLPAALGVRRTAPE